MARTVDVERMKRYAHRGRIERRDWFDLPPDVKVQIIEAMGFTPMGSDHTYDCPHPWDSGLVCNCVGDPTVWNGPLDVQEMRGETWEQRLAKRRASSVS